MAEKNSETKSILPSGIPEATFVEDVDAFMAQPDNSSVETVLSRLEEQHQKYSFMEMNLKTKKNRLKVQIPDLKSTLAFVEHLIERRGSDKKFETHFQLSEQVWTKATIKPTEKVNLWLGANVMLEYSLEEAKALLSNNLTSAKESLEVCDEELGFIRDQTTTVEVSILLQKK
ncbi:DgyrCDS361 [Dimorphilus gyrociliatus]|uniref:Prefoldin subunit 3 n=1 Tax=Dimorphilus gyrociliatus TaxID=2664684 RepID=A0A7I8V6W2_9ANNE|nr:DgyrCDS361 [Dimorphilus gyrociliatus]